MSKPQTRILFLTGNPKENLLRELSDAGRSIVAVVVPKSKKYQAKYQGVVSQAASRRIPVVVADVGALETALAQIDYDLLLSCGYPFKISEPVCGKAKLAVNFHPALLPKHRGRYLNYILIDKDEYSGVTAHKIDPGYDTGPIIKQASFKVSPFDTVKSLTRKSAEIEITLAEEIIRLYEKGEITFTPQKEQDSSSHFAPRTPADSEIDPAKPLIDSFFKIRACDPELYPAFFYVDGQKVLIKICRENKPPDEADLI